MWKYLYIFDYCRPGIYQIDVPDTNGEDIDVEELLRSKGFNIDECSYMFSDDVLCVQHVETIN